MTDFNANMDARVDGVTDWMWHGACRGMDMRVFFPETGDSANTARRVCASCLVKPECVEYVVANDEILHGVWGGMVYREYRKLRQERRGEREC